MRRMGQLAMERLVQLMKGEGPIAQIHIPAEMIVRASTGPVRS
jgi:DNA-binding LacI/PurR family transcriptional regulator